MMPRCALLAAIASVACSGSVALAQSACCRESDCVDVENEQDCNALGGFFISASDCASGACGVGACCSPGSCVQTDAYSCAVAGRDFAGAGLSCLDDPCGGQLGACCTSGSCTQTTLTDCGTAGGDWLGGGTNCAGGGCAIGACCAPGSCTQLEGFECLKQGGTFVSGGDCAAGDPCDVPNSCPLDALVSRPPSRPGFFAAGASETGFGVQRWDDYTGAAGPIDGLRWWGLSLRIVGQNLVACNETDNTFQISFHENDAGTPGVEVCSYTLIANRTPTGLIYQGFELNEYQADLQSPCVLTSGWISIVGMGNPNCGFYWMSTPELDDRSYCDVCDPENQPFDLSFCLQGTAGGVTGACCGQSTGICSDGADIAACAEVGYRFVEATSCGAISPPCTQETGACCRPDGPCAAGTAADCLAQDGNWLGAGAPCTLCPQLGGCCVEPGNCSLATADDCADAGRTFAGEGTTCNDCPPLPTCNTGSLFEQNPDGAGSFVAYASEHEPNLRRFEDISGVAGSVTSLTWWGLDLEPLGNGLFRECAESEGQFEISFHRDAAGFPGEVVCSYVVTPAYTPTVHRYFGTVLNEYSIVLPQTCTVIDGWVSIQGGGDPACQFYWMSSSDTDGSHYCEGCQVAFEGSNLSVCIEGTQGGVFGACCHGSSATCVEGAEITTCTDSLDRLMSGATCNDFDPPCGVILGACCFEDTATCAQLTDAECSIQGGSWLGANSLCSRCPCAAGCPPDGIIEGEPICTDGYEDSFNGGCNSVPPVFTPMSFGDTVCGEGGVYFDESDVLRDLDWYELTLASPSQVTWTVVAEFPVQAWITDGSNGCPEEVLTTGAGFECETVQLTAAAGAGTYWFVVGAAAFTDTAACGAEYSARLTRVPPGNGDADGDGDVDLQDYEEFHACMIQAQPAPACLSTFDEDADGDIDLFDFAGFQDVFGD